MSYTGFFAPESGEEVSFEKKDFSDKVALIDADYLKYYVTADIYKKVMDEGEQRSIQYLEEKIDFFLSRDFFNRFKAKAYVFCFSAPSNKIFRNAITQEKKYKGNRDGKKDYTYYPDKYEDMSYVYEFIHKRYPTLYFDDLEADDLVSFLQDEEKTFIYSNDKDLKQVHGFHYDQEIGVLKYTPKEHGMKLLLYQMMLGDSTDNFGGIPGFGKKALSNFKKETKHLTAEELYHSVVKKFMDKFGVLEGADAFSEMWMIASTKINRGDYFKEKYASAINTLKTLIEDV